jgi:hypothetical protein
MTLRERLARMRKSFERACAHDMRTMLVAPGVPKGTPATTRIRSPGLANPSRLANLHARRAISLIAVLDGEAN